MRAIYPVIALAILLAACQGEKETTALPPTKAPASPMATIYFSNVAEQVGLKWRHDNGASPHKYFPETMSGGGAFFDFDSDGDLDLYVLNGGQLDAAPATRPANALFRNDGGHFVEVAAEYGAADRGYGMGVAAGDIDNDGDLDLYATNFTANILLRNDGNHFADISSISGTADSLWGTSCAFADYDRDGDLDLYVANYVRYNLDDARADYTPYMAGYESYKGPAQKGYPHPANFPGSPDRLFQNDGSGRFTEVAERTGVGDANGKGLGVVFADYDADGWPDIYVANDAVRNFLYHNEGNGTFAEGAALSGVAYGQDGQMEAGMGVDWGDYDGDGFVDLTVTNFQAEPNALYHSENAEFFSVETFTSGTGMITLPFLGFGTQFFDYDNDGDLDLFTANGHVLDNIESIDRSTQYPQRNLLFRNDGKVQTGNVRFSEVGIESGLALERVSRGSASGDYDDDGDVDLVVFNAGQELTLLRNEGGAQDAAWLWVQLIGRESNHNGIGARLILSVAGKQQLREVRGSRSYLSQSDLRVHFGLGNGRADWLEVHWPSGRKERFYDIAANQYLILNEGTGNNVP
jgi:enediyne biosynthesis protein E4